MRFDSSLAKFVAAFALLLAVACMPAAAVSVRGASHYGVDPSFSACDDPTATSPCQSFDLTPTVVNFSGNTFDVFQFVINDGMGGVSLFNIVDLANLGPGATFSLPPAFFPPALTEVLGCGGAGSPFDGSTGPTDSSFPNPNPVNGICTPGSSAPALTLNANGSFTTGANFDFANLVLDAPVGAVSTPEPGTLALLGVGLVALARKFRQSV